MPRRQDIDHHLLHFRLERDDDTATEEVKRQSGVIVTAFEAAPVNSQTSLNFLIARMSLITGNGKADADAIRERSQILKSISHDNRPTELLAFLERQIDG